MHYHRKDVYTGADYCKEGLQIELASILYNIGIGVLLLFVSALHGQYTNYHHQCQL